MKVNFLNILASSFFALFSLDAFSQNEIHAETVVITANSSDASTLFDLPNNAPKALADKKIKMEEKLVKYKHVNENLSNVLNKMDFDSLEDNDEKLLQALAQSKNALIDLENAESDFLGAKEDFLATDALVSSNPSKANSKNEVALK